MQWGTEGCSADESTSDLREDVLHEPQSCSGFVVS